MYKEITKKYLLTHEFRKTGLESDLIEKPNVSGMFAPDTKLPMSDHDKMTQLRVELNDRIAMKWGSYTEAGTATQISAETLRKYVSRGEKRRISRMMLAKIVVAMGLNIEEAAPLFVLQGYALDADNILLDAVVVHCLGNHYGLDEFYDTCIQVDLKFD